MSSRTLFLLGSVSIAQEVGVLGSNHDLVFLDSLRIEPYETCAVHMLQKNSFILVSNILPVGIMLAILA
jgi:hypothetical protein